MTMDKTRAPISGVDYAAESYRLALQAVFGSTLDTFTGGVTPNDPSHGISHPDAFEVTQNGTPNMSVNVAAGLAWVRGTEASDQGCYPAASDATVNLTIAAADATNPRKDIVGIRIYDSNYGSSDPADDGEFLEVITGTPAASPSDPTLPDNFLALARVTVAASDTSITTGEITDLRPLARDWNSAWGQLYDNTKTSGGSGATSHTLFTFDFEYLAGRRYRIDAVADCYDSSVAAGEVMSLEIKADGTRLTRAISKSIEVNVATTLHARRLKYTPGAGTKTMTVVLASAIGYNVGYSGSSTAPVQVTVEDVGPI